MFCIKCGSKIEDGNRFCTTCGTPVEAPIEGVVEASPKPAPTPKATPKPAPNAPAQESAPNGNPKAPLIIAIVAGILLLICVIAVGVLVYPKVRSFINEKTSAEEVDEDDDEDEDDEDIDEEAEDEDISDAGNTAAEADEAPAAEAESTMSSDEAAALLANHANGFKSPIGRDYKVYLKKTDYYDLDVAEIPVGEFSQLIDDYDRDGMPELLVCSLNSDYNMILDMYEVVDGEVILSSSIDLGSYGLGVNFPGEFVEDVFIWEKEDETLICAEFAGIVSLIADGTSLQLAAYRYDGAFSYVTEASYAGSDGEESDSFRTGMRELGISYDWSEIMSRHRLISEEVDGPHYVGSIVCAEDINYMRFYDWSEDAVEGDEIAIAKLSFQGEGFVSPLPSRPASEYILEGSDYRYISEEELYGFDAEKCRLARNELYARYGRIFDDEELNAYFSQFSWYYPSISAKDFKESMLNDYEIYNRDLIVQYEKDMGYR